ncbi:MAG: hypothetical protein RBQ94_04005 [Methanimicrococcus sp.]|nr:hypothetical protein [Methanimicrococcus sp.]
MPLKRHVAGTQRTCGRHTVNTKMYGGHTANTMNANANCKTDRWLLKT